MAWLAVNPDGKFKIFEFKPKRCIEPITKEADYLEEDYHGHFFRLDIPTGDSRKFWGDPYYPPHSLFLSYHKGIDVDKASLSKELQNLNWKNEPVEI